MFQFIYFPLLLMVIHLTSICMSIPHSSFRSNEFSEKRKIASGLAGDLAKKYEKLYGLKFCGISEASPEGKYENLGMSFTTRDTVSKQEARKILLHIQGDFLEAINNNSELKNHLLVYPFTGKNIVITIVVRDSTGRDAYSPDLGLFSIYNNELKYVYYPFETNSRSQPVYEYESIFEAEKLVKNNN